MEKHGKFIQQWSSQYPQLSPKLIEEWLKIHPNKFLPRKQNHKIMINSRLDCILIWNNLNNKLDSFIKKANIKKEHLAAPHESNYEKFQAFLGGDLHIFFKLIKKLPTIFGIRSSNQSMFYAFWSFSSILYESRISDETYVFLLLLLAIRLYYALSISMKKIHKICFILSPFFQLIGELNWKF